MGNRCFEIPIPAKTIYDYPLFETIDSLVTEHSQSSSAKLPSNGGLRYVLYLDDTQKIRRILLEYPGNIEKSLWGDYYVGSMLFDNLKKWQPNDGKDEFMLRAGRLAKYIVCKLFVARGSASIAEVIWYSMAKAKGIDLGNMQLQNGLSWAWQALTTSSTEEFAKWFNESLFPNAKYNSPVIQPPPNKRGP